MKIAKSLAAAALATAASFGSPVFAADVSAPIGAVIVFPGGENYFGSAWWGLNSEPGDTFSNRYVFSVTGNSAVAAQVGSISPDASRGLDITGLNLYSWDGNLLSTGTSLSDGTYEAWRLGAAELAAGNYYLQVQGTVVGPEGGAFSGSLALAPVPEPETYGMMLAGLGVLGFMARRRKAAKQ